MLTKLTMQNFKLFEEAEVPLGNGFVFVGPNDGGKTSALQALTLWHTGLQKWAEKYKLRDESPIPIPEKRPGITVNRLDLTHLPVREMNLIWLNRKTRKGPNENIRINLIVEGISHGREWKCGLEFDYSNPEVFHCRPLRVAGADGSPDRMEVPPQAMDVRLAFMPPMSGLASEEALIQEGRINVLLGQGQTAEVLRNLCYRVYSKDDEKKDWQSLAGHIKDLFGVALKEPRLLPHRGTVVMDYADKGGSVLDLSSSGRGMQQVLLLLAYLYDRAADTVFLLDEPDAHLEILRQRQIYNRINEVAETRNAQVISASHSEVLLNEAAERGCAVAFVGRPHVLGGSQTSRVMAALREIGYEQYYEAERKGWVLYLEGANDLKILQAFAEKLDHPAKKILQDPFVKYIANQPQKSREHFHDLKEAKKDLRGFLLLDHIGMELREAEDLLEHEWKKCEIENYLCSRRAIVSYVVAGPDREDLFEDFETEKREAQIKEEIKKLEDASKTLGRPQPFSDEVKASDDFLEPLFKNFTLSLGMPESAALRKKDFYKLAEHLPPEEIDEEVVSVLDKIVNVSGAEVERPNS